MNSFIPLFSIFFALSTQCLLGQADSIILDKNHKFKDGVYRSFEEFQEDQPTISWTDLEGDLFTNPITRVTYVDSLFDSQSTNIDLKGVWGLSLGGIPYVNVHRKTPAGLHIFAGMKSRGGICYLEYSYNETREKAMQAFNPLTGRPFREATIKNEIQVLQKLMLNFENGEITAFNKENLLDWIKEDQQLSKSVASLGEDDFEKLFKSLLIFCDRNPVYILLKD